MAYVNGVSHPMLMFDPVAIFDTLLVGDSVNYNIIISNPGDDTLTFDAGTFTVIWQAASLMILKMAWINGDILERMQWNYPARARDIILTIAW